MIRPTRLLAVLAVSGVLAAGGAVAATASPGSGDGPLTAVAGTYRVVSDDHTGPWTRTAAGAEVELRLYYGSRVEVVGDGSSCEQPDTRETRYSDAGHFAVCTGPTPDGVPAEWARPAR